MKKNKEWLKREIKKQDSELECVARNYLEDVKVLISKDVLELIDQMDEPEKAVIPQFVADWIESFYAEGGHEWELLEIANHPISDNFSEPDGLVFSWLKSGMRSVFVQSVVNGYTTEPEKQYRLSLKNNLDLKFLICWSEEEEKWETYGNASFIGNRDKKAIFTESELSKIDETSFMRIEVME